MPRTAPLLRQPLEATWAFLLYASGAWGPGPSAAMVSGWWDWGRVRGAGAVDGHNGGCAVLSPWSLLGPDPENWGVKAGVASLRPGQVGTEARAWSPGNRTEPGRGQPGEQLLSWSAPPQSRLGLLAPQLEMTSQVAGPSNVHDASRNRILRAEKKSIRT